MFIDPTRVRQALHLRREKLSNFEIIFVIYLFEGNHNTPISVQVRKHLNLAMITVPTSFALMIPVKRLVVLQTQYFMA